MATKQPIILTDEIVPPPALIRAGLDALPSIIRAQGERASRRFIEFFTASIRNRNTRMAYARAVKQFFDWCDERRLQLADIEGHQRRYLHRTSWHPGQQADRQAASGRHLPAVRLSHHRRDSGRQPCRFGTGPRYVVKRGKTAVLSSEETRKLLDSIESNTLIGLRDRANRDHGLQLRPGRRHGHHESRRLLPAPQTVVAPLAS